MSDQSTGDDEPGEDAERAGKRPRIRVRNNPDAIRQLRAAVKDRVLPETYVTAGEPVLIQRVSGVPVLAMDQDSPLPIARTPITSPLLANLLAHHTETVKAKAGDVDEEVTPSQQVLNAVLSGAEWGALPTLVGIVGTPVVRADGSLVEEPGYDAKTGLYLAPRVKLPPLPREPTRAQVEASLEFLHNRLLGDFPWVDDGDRANYLGLMVTQIVRRYRCSRVPLGLITATMAGSGKTTLAACIGLLMGQQQITWSADDTELRKEITTVFMTEGGVVIFDNLNAGTPVDSPIIASLATGEKWTNRILGGNKMGEWANDRLWLFTGNNLHVGGDIARRSVLVRLQPDRPHPEQRTDHTIPDLSKWIVDTDNQAEVLWHVLVLVKHWCLAGAPSKHVAAMGQFTAWADVVGGFLDHHGVKGFLDNLGEVRARDDDERQWAAFFAQWYARYGSTKRTAGQLRGDAVSAEEGRADPWNGVFPTTGRGEPISAKSLGRQLTALVEGFRGDYRLRGEEDSHLNQWVFWVEQYSVPASEFARTTK